MKIEVDTEDLENAIVDKLLMKLLPKLDELFINRLFDEEIKGYKEAAKLLNIPVNTLKSRKQNGVYEENFHYRTTGSSIQSPIIFYRDNLYDFEKVIRMKKSKKLYLSQDYES